MPLNPYVTKALSVLLFVVTSFFLIINSINTRVAIQKQIFDVRQSVNREVGAQTNLINNLYNQTNEETRRKLKDGQIERIDPQQNKELQEYSQ